MKRKIRFFVFTLLTSSFLFGQTISKIDSLVNTLNKKGKDTTAVKTLLLVSEYYCSTDAQKSLKNALEALRFTQLLKWNKGFALSYFRIGMAYNSLGNFKESLLYRFKELEEWKNLNDKDNICMTLGNIGVSYSDMGDNLKAMEYYISSLKLADEIGSSIQTVNNLCNIGSLYKEQGNSQKAFEYYFKSLKLAEELGDEKNIAINQGNLGNLYSEENNFNKALESYLIALQIDERTGNKKNLSAWLANIGNLYQLQSDSAVKIGDISLSKVKSEKALEYYFKALKYTEEVGNKYLEAYALGNIGGIYTIRQNCKEVEVYLTKSFDIAHSINAIDIVMDDHQRFYELYKKTNNLKLALEHHEKFLLIKDSVSDKNNKKAISELEIKFNSEKKEGENKSLVQENKLQTLTISNNRNIMIGLIVLIVLGIAIGFLIIRQNRLRARQFAAQFEQKLLRTQMNPHFIFNSLSSIESFIYDHQPKEAGEYLSEFSRLMRLILENSTSEYIPLEKEVEILNYYLSLQKLRLDDNLIYSITVDKELNSRQISLPPMLTQPFIENAIEHGFRGSKKQGEIAVSFSRVENNLQIQITDNGVGIENAQKQKDLHKTHKSLAIQITMERLKYLNKSKNKKLSLTITDLTNEQKNSTGTKITFLVPLQ